MKTPDEIKKGLDCCRGINAPCDGCPYNMETMDYDESVSMLHDDALAYIRQLEAERDALVRDLRVDCTTCSHSYLNNPAIDCCPYAIACQGHHLWEWRGLPESPKEESAHD